jgi:Flp pilus assembly secretin CpaC
VKIAEVSRDLLKQVGMNLFSTDPTSGFQFGINQGAGTAPAPGAPFSVAKILNVGNRARSQGKPVRAGPDRYALISPRPTAW